MIDCPVCEVYNPEYQDYCDECGSDLDPDVYLGEDDGCFDDDLFFDEEHC